MAELLDQASILEALADLAGDLRSRGVLADIYLVDGAAMALAYDDRRATRDLDGLLRPDVEVHRAAWAVAERRGLPRSWLNDQAASYVPKGDDHGARTVFDHANLRVMAASPERMLAMKVNAARRSDIDDIVALATMLNLTTFDEVEVIRRAAFPDLALDERRRLVVEDAIERVRQRR